MAKETSIVILDGGRRTPRADILINNNEPGLFSRFSTTHLGGMAIRATLANTKIDPSLIGHVVMGALPRTAGPEEAAPRAPVTPRVEPPGAATKAPGPPTGVG